MFEKAVHEARLTIWPIEWKGKYPTIHAVRWLIAGLIVAILTGNLPLSKLNPFGQSRSSVQDQMGKTVTAIIAYPVPLSIAIAKWVSTESNRVCRWLGINCDINPGRTLHFKLRNPFVRTKALGSLNPAVNPAAANSTVTRQGP